MLLFPLFSGYVGALEDSPAMQDTATPFTAQIVTKLPFRYGKTEAERQDSYVFVRIQAFSSRACLGKSFDTVALGTPIRGVLDITTGDYNSAQLVA